MPEYIEREAAMDIFGDVPMWDGYYEPYPFEVHCAIVGVVKLIKEELRKVPTADVAPVRHGRWVTHSDRPDSLICSVCKCGFDMWKHDPHNFCPNCGSKMDEGKNNAID